MSAASVPPETAPAFQAGDVLRVVRERFGTIFAVAFVVVMATLAVLVYLPTLYASSASVMLDPRKNNVADLSSVLSQLPTDPASLQNQIQILESHDLALEVITKLKLYDDPEYTAGVKPDDGPAAAREKIVTAFSKTVAVAAEGLSTTLTVTVTSRDPAKAALIANTLVDTYIDDQVQAKRDIGSKTTDWLVARTHDLAGQLQQQEAAVQRYKADNNLTEAPDGSSLADQQISAISNQLVTAKADLAQKQATDERVAALIKAGDTADVSQILASPLIVQLRTQEATLIAQESDLATRYGPRHPKMAAVETQKRDLDAKIAVEVGRLTGSIANDVAVARANVASLQGSLAIAERQATSQNLVRVKLRALESNAQSTRTMYEAFVTRLRETQDQDVIQSPDARVISRAAIPTVPSAPKRMLILGASLPAGLMLGLLVALLAERFSAPVPARVAPRTAFRPVPAPVSAMAMLPGLADPRAAAAPIDWPASEFSRATAQLLGRTMREGKVIAVTASDEGGMKSALAVALARTASRAGLRVAMIDAGLQHPAAARAMGLGPMRFGLIEALAGQAPLARAFCRDPRSNAQLLCAARPPRDPDAVLASAQMAGLVAHLRRACDLVIVDAPASSAPARLRAMAAICDVTLWVGRDGRIVAA